jgi:hypothetical protein
MTEKLARDRPCIRDMDWIRSLYFITDNVMRPHKIYRGVTRTEPPTWQSGAQLLLYVSTVRSLQSLIILKPLENVQVIKARGQVYVWS